jgi:arginine exporter protein ArgO
MSAIIRGIILGLSITAPIGSTNVEVDSNVHFVPGIVLTISNPVILLLWTGIMGADLAASRLLILFV